MSKGDVATIEEKYYKVWLTLINNLGIKKYLGLINQFHCNKNIYLAQENDLKDCRGVGENLIKQILDRNIRIKAKRHLQFMIKNNIDIISIEDEEYPDMLKTIYNPPISLYIRGNKCALKEFNIAIIGCRNATEYGRKVAQNFSYRISKKKINIVSGLARGIDSMAHMGAVYAKEKTIAVVGSGLDIIYPKENFLLAEKIIQNGGAIISEYPFGTKPDKMNFVARNRIISGISRGVIIVEAKVKSGTLITVDFALEQGRDVFVVPGNIDSVNSAGTNELIRQGAKIVTSYEQILEEYEIQH